MDFAITDYRILEDKENKFKVFCFPEDEEGAKKLLNNLTKAFELYTKWFGPLKVFSGLTVIEIPEGYGSQADITTILQQESEFDKNTDSHYGFYHELSHLWNVMPRDPLPSRLESEGLAMLLQHLVQERLESKSDALIEAVKKMRERMKKTYVEHPGWKKVPISSYGEEDLTDLSYRTGQIFFYILYELMGEEPFLDAVGSFYQDYYESGASLDDFVLHIKKRSSVDLSILFKEWIYGVEAGRVIASDASLTEIIARYR
jgi:aminopeptidase N